MNFNIDHFITLFSCILSGFFGYKISKFSIKNPQKIKVLQKQLNLVYLPLFRKLESNLYKEISPTTALEYINFFNSLKENYYELIDSELINVFQIFERSTSQKSISYSHFESVCYKLDKIFEETRRKLLLPTRNFAYKLNNRQFPQHFRNIINSFFTYLLKIIMLLLLTIVLSYALQLIQFIINWIQSIL